MLKCIQDDAGEVDYNGDIPYEITEAFSNVCDYLREVLPMENKEDIEKVRSYFGKEEAVFQELLNYVKGKMKGYYRMAPIRELEKTSPDTVTNILGQILDNFVFRFDPRFCRTYYEELGFKELTDLYGVAITLDSLVSFVVKDNYTKEAIGAFLAEITYMSKTTCEYLAEKIDQNFEQLKLTIILNQFGQK